MTAYYNEIDPAAAHILRALIDAGVIAPGDVDTRSIKDVQPDDLAGYTQCHFFAGGGLWSVAARLAGWPDDRPLWTGSCPCQPFSAAGKGLGTNDPRHLWPDFHRLIRAARPSVVMGEQVAGKAGYGWFDGVRADLAGEGYAGRAVDFPACGVDAPHQRNRLYWIAVDGRVADHDGTGSATNGRDAGEVSGVQASQCGAENDAALLGRVDDPSVGYLSSAGADAQSHVGHNAGVRRSETIGKPGDDQTPDSSRSSSRAERTYGGNGPADGAEAAGNVADRAGEGRNAAPYPRVRSEAQGERPWHGEPERPHGVDGGLHADTDRGGRSGWQEGQIGGAFERTASQRPLLRNGTYWSDADWIACHDGKARRAKPGIRFLVDGLPGRVDLWRVGGNAIVPEAAAEVIAAFLDTEAERVRLTGTGVFG